MSQRNNTTFGILESQDIIKAVEFAKQKGFKEENIAIIGNSLGGISLLLSAEKLNGIGAMVIDSAAATLEPSVKQILQIENNVPAIFNPGIFFILKEIYGVNVAEVRPIDHVSRVPDRTFLFLHGGKDTTIPVENSKQLLKASNSNSKLVIFENGYHIETFKTDPKKYLDAVMSFLEQELNSQKSL